MQIAAAAHQSNRKKASLSRLQAEDLGGAARQMHRQVAPRRQPRRPETRRQVPLLVGKRKKAQAQRMRNERTRSLAYFKYRHIGPLYRARPHRRRHRRQRRLSQPGGPFSPELGQVFNMGEQSLRLAQAQAAFRHRQHPAPLPDEAPGPVHKGQGCGIGRAVHPQVGAATFHVR